MRPTPSRRPRPFTLGALAATVIVVGLTTANASQTTSPTVDQDRARTSVQAREGVMFATYAPVITGSPAAGHDLYLSTGSWSDMPKSYAIEWLRDGEPIPGAAKRTYSVSAADSGKLISARVTATNGDGDSASFTSAPMPIVTGAAGGGAPFVAEYPAASGETRVGGRLSGDRGIWHSAVSYRYQWLRDGLPISGATTLTHEPTMEDLKGHIAFQVTAVDAAGVPTVEVSSPLPSVALAMPVKASSKPRIAGVPRPGRTLRAVAPNFTPDADRVTHEWTRDGRRVRGANEQTFRVRRSDARHVLRVEITAHKDGHIPAEARSASIRIKRR